MTAMRIRGAVVATLLLTACKHSEARSQVPGGPAGSALPRTWGVVTLETESVPLQDELAGRTTASLVSDVRPQVNGVVKARTFERARS